MAKNKIGLVQINNSFSGQNYFPYSVGLLQAYALKNSQSIDDFEFLLPIYKRIKVDDALKQLNSANVVLFSVYVWNINLSLKIAEGLKEKCPESTIIFGGPQVPDKPEKFLRENQFIDLACMKEGENAFASILDNYENKNWLNVPSVAFIDKKNKYIETIWAERIKDLDEIPSPYLTGVFDTLINPYAIAYQESSKDKNDVRWGILMDIS